MGRPGPAFGVRRSVFKVWGFGLNVSGLRLVGFRLKVLAGKLPSLPLKLPAPQDNGQYSKGFGTPVEIKI